MKNNQCFPTRVPFDVEAEPYFGLKLSPVTEKMKMYFFGDLAELIRAEMTTME